MVEVCFEIFIAFRYFHDEGRNITKVTIIVYGSKVINTYMYTYSDKKSEGAYVLL